MLRRPVKRMPGHPVVLFSCPPNEGGRSAVRRREVDGAFRRSTTVCLPAHMSGSTSKNPVTKRIPGTAPHSASGTSRETPLSSSGDGTGDTFWFWFVKNYYIAILELL